MLGNDYAQARKQYVEDARRSFDEQEEYDGYNGYESKTETRAMSFLKLRLLIAVCIFAAFVLCDQTGNRFYNYTTDEIVEKIKEERFQSQLDSIREAWSAITKRQGD